MASLAEEVVPRHWSAPRRDGEVLLDPPPQNWPAVWQRNLLGARSLPSLIAQWRADTRGELWRASRDYTARYRDVSALAAPDAPLVLSGHQPSLFHPGVWFKNFVLDQFGRRFQAHAIQLIVDNDVLRQTAIRVPTGSLDHPRVAYVEYDRPGRVVPWEVATITDADTFASFASRAAQAIREFVPAPLCDPFWRDVRELYPQFGNIGQAFAAARHRLEQRQGLETYELPLSMVCQTTTFREFAGHLMSRAAEFAAAHNACLAQFRRERGLRSENHPVPNLVATAAEVETPFWIWNKQAPVRRRLYVQFRGQGFTLTDHDRFERRIERGVDWAEQLDAVEKDGFAIRPRALITTMYARLVLSDLFLHGIGGALYDLVGDAIAQRFFDVVPPTYLTATATIHLPIPCPAVEPTDLRRIASDLRDLLYHPEKHLLSKDPSIAMLVNEKRAWIARGPIDGSRRPRHEAIARINRELGGHLQAHREMLFKRRQQLEADLHRAKILGSREHAFVLFPAALADQLKSLAGSVA